MLLLRTALLSLAAAAFCCAPAHAGRFGAGDRPSDFYGRNIQNEQSIALSDLQGKWVLVDFFATWCGPCMAELPNLVETTAKYRGENFEVLAVSLDVEQTMDNLRPTLEKHGVEFPVIFSGGGWKSPAVQEWGVQAIPDNYLISPDGVILMHGLHGAALDEALSKVLNFKGSLTPICLSSSGKMLDGQFVLDLNYSNPLAAKSEARLETTFMVPIRDAAGTKVDMDYKTSEQPITLENPDGWETSSSISLAMPAETEMVYYKLSVFHPQLEMWVGFEGYVWPPKPAAAPPAEDTGSAEAA